MGGVFETAPPFYTPRRCGAGGLGARCRRQQDLHPADRRNLRRGVPGAPPLSRTATVRLPRISTHVLTLSFGGRLRARSSLESIIEQNKGGYCTALRQHRERSDGDAELATWAGVLLDVVEVAGQAPGRRWNGNSYCPSACRSCPLDPWPWPDCTAALPRLRRSDRPARSGRHQGGTWPARQRGHLVEQGVGRGTWYVASGQ